jgi:gamma-glutamyltranspeptidase/glutathione hydrolase
MNFDTIESSFKPMSDCKSAEARNGMVSTAFPDATKAGVRILKKGGNAVDAAVAAAFALGVCEPQASGLGGQTMMLIYRKAKDKDKVTAIDGSSRAPSLAHAKAIYRNDRSLGYRATTVPSTPATLWYVHDRYGRLPWKEILKPAIRICKNGYAITELQHRLQVRELKNFKDVESRSGAKYFLKDGAPYEVGEVFRQPDLANLLRTLAKKGIKEFYMGKVAKKIDADMRENGGLLRYDDLALIPWPIERKALKRRFRGLTVYTMPPPGSGRTLLFTLLMIDAIPPGVLTMDQQRYNYLLAEIFRKALLEREDRPFDPDFYPQVSEKEMLSRKYARACILKIMSKVDSTLLPVIATDDEKSGETTHLSVMDGEGMAVSLTQSIERVYGSKAAAEGLGFLYNNYLNDYEYSKASHPFYLRPNASPWATVAPTLIFAKKRLWMALGSPGSERIFSSITQFLLHVVDEGMPIGDAMTAPRIHCSLGGMVSLEADRFPEELVEFLKEKKYRIDKREPYSFYLGAIHAVLKKHDGSGFQGVAEVRRDGTAGGY